MARLTTLTAALVLITASLVGAQASAAAEPALTAGENFTCVLAYDGVVRCFGYNNSGQLGNATNFGTNTPNSTPTPVDLGGTAASVSAGLGHTCAVLDGGTTKCFGYNSWGGIGSATNNGTDTGIYSPNTVSLGAATSVVDAGYGSTCAALATGVLKCFGLNQYGELGSSTNSGTGNANPNPLTVSLGGDARTVSAGDYHSCALLTNGVVKCFGLNFYGQLGTGVNNGNYDPNPTPATVALGGSALAVAAGHDFTCALVESGAVKCFGFNYSGQLGHAGGVGGYTPQSIPVTVNLGGPAKTVAAGYDHTCVLMADGSVKCFGKNLYGQLGVSANVGTSNPKPLPATVALGGAATALTTGGNHTCALMTDGSVKCWGRNALGQLGFPANTGANPAPTSVPGLNLLPPTPAGPTSVAGRIAKPKLKSKLRKGRLKVTGTVAVSGAGLSAVHCRGKLRVAVTLNARKKTRKLATKSFALKYARSKCSAAVSLSLAKKYKGKKPTFRFSLTGAPLLSAPETSVKKKL